MVRINMAADHIFDITDLNFMNNLKYLLNKWWFFFFNSLKKKKQKKPLL